MVDANIACMNIQHYEDNIINIGSGYNTSVNEIANMLSRTAPRINEPPVIEPPLMLADITKANEYLKWSPVIKLNDWINNYKKDLGL